MQWRDGLSLEQQNNVELNFDTRFYLGRYPDIERSGFNALDHYMAFGWREMRDPASYFSTSGYIRAYVPDAVAIDCNPFLHWICSGGRYAALEPPAIEMAADRQAIARRYPMLAENAIREVAAAFDADFYFAKYLDVATSGQKALEHFLDFGWRENRDPCQGFSTPTFLAVNRLWSEIGNPFVHWAVERLGPIDGEMARVSKSVGDLWKEWSARDMVRTYFDAAFYADQYEGHFHDDDHAFDHYMSLGWRHLRDPSPDFSTLFYLRRHEDVRDANVNPLLHWVLYGKTEQRRTLPFRASIARRQLYRTISALAVLQKDENLESLLAAIGSQSIAVDEIVVLADGARQDQPGVALPAGLMWIDRRLASPASTPDDFKTLADRASGDLVWFLGHERSFDSGFLEQTTEAFKDISVTMAIPSWERAIGPASSVSSNIGRDRRRRSGHLSLAAGDWFSQSIVSGRIMRPLAGFVCRKPSVDRDAWSKAARLGSLSTWFCALNVISGGNVVIVPSSVRSSASPDANAARHSASFFKEVEDLLVEIKSRWMVPRGVLGRFRQILREEVDVAFQGAETRSLGRVFDWRRVVAQGRSRPHIVVSLWAFWAGGGEFFPIMLANELCSKGMVVSMLGFDLQDINEDMRRRLNPSIAVFDAAWIDEEGAEGFLESSQVSLVHSHTVGSEIRFFDVWQIGVPLPYLATLHGSYESSDVDDIILQRIAKPVSHFVYTADKNLTPLEPLAFPPSKFTKLANAMPVDSRPFPASRHDMGIDASAIVFTMVARGVPEKGWHPTIKAFLRLRRKHPQREMFLLLCGAGIEPDRLGPRYAKNASIKFLGYQSCIHGLYRLSDVCLVASRFVGESFPLCIIQALQAGTPVVSTRIGETASMIESDVLGSGGTLVEAETDSWKFVAALEAAMEGMLDDERRAVFKSAASRLGRIYDMGRLCDLYSDMYDELIDEAACADDAASNASPKQARSAGETETAIHAPEPIGHDDVRLESASAALSA